MRYVPITVSVLLAEAVGVLGSVFTASSVQTWYPTLVKPVWNPPNWVFGPVWTMLFAFMGIAAYLVWRKRTASGAVSALISYGVQLGLNLLWSVLFFGLRAPGYAAGEILVLLVSIVVTMVLFLRTDRRAGMLFLPYVAWVSFAAVLNWQVWLLN